ncbi:serpin-Z1-like [Brassica napus]|nr:serpin-Z1-like [Brassica napus]
MPGDFFSYHLDVYPGFKVLSLSYRKGRCDGRTFSMQIYLPDEKDGLPAMLEMLASTPEDEDTPSYRADIGELKIPRFKFGYHFEATEALKSLGLSLPLERIFHKSCIQVDEVGTEAAAAAADVSVGACGPAEKKYDFVADHPFLFLVKEWRSGVVLFLGQVLDPSMH